MNLFKKPFKSSLFLFALLAISAFALQSCGNSKSALVVEVEPIVDLVKDQGADDFSIVLNDMDITENEDNIIYKHKYVILKPKDDQLSIDSTDWVNVGEEIFKQNEDNLGMELVSRHGETISTTPKPVGFDWAIGNENLGKWEDIDSTSTDPNRERRWRYRPGSIFLTYWLLSRPTSMGVYNRYASGYRGTQNTFHGSGSNKYGTASNYQKGKRSSFYKRQSTSKSWSSFKKSKSTSRYGGSSSSRGRSGGVGK